MLLRLPVVIALTFAPALATLPPQARAAAPMATAEPVRQVIAFVPPYYEAAPSFGESPKVKVSPEHDALLASVKAADVVKARDQISASPDLVSPLTMMVLAIRLYDMGLRDDAVFWFYAARGRYSVLEKVLDTSSLTLAGLANGMQDLNESAGPTLYGYAFCDLAREQATEDKALQWTIAHPYRQLLSPQLPALDDDRNKAIAAAVEALRQQVAGGHAAIADPARRAQLQDARKRDQADAKYCWK
jgi:hypothetical protein